MNKINTRLARLASLCLHFAVRSAPEPAGDHLPGSKAVCR